MEGRN